MKPLSHPQRTALAAIARRAWKRRGALGSFDDFRHAEVFAAVGRGGLSECSNGDFAPLAAHFESLAGNPDRALNWHLRSQSDPARRLRWILDSEARGAGLAPEYVESICRAQFKSSVDEATESELKLLVVTLRARIAARKRRAEREVARG